MKKIKLQPQQLLFIFHAHGSSSSSSSSSTSSSSSSSSSSSRSMSVQGELKKCDERCLVQNCTFFCATLLYGVFSIFLEFFYFFSYSYCPKKSAILFSQNQMIRKVKMCIYIIIANL